MKSQEAALLDRAPMVMLLGAAMTGKTVALCAKAASVRSACVMTRQVEGFREAFDTWCRASEQEWTYNVNERRWRTDDRQVIVFDWRADRVVDKARGWRFDAILFDGVMPDDRSLDTLRLSTSGGGQVYVALRDEWSVHSLGG